MDLTIDWAKGMCLRKESPLNVMLCAVSGLNLKSMGLIRCLYIVNGFYIRKYTKKPPVSEIFLHFLI